MKTLANCTPREFLVQTNKIRKSVSKWLAITDILGIRKEKPQLPADASDEEKKAALEKQVRQNLTSVLDAVLEKHPDETAELLGLLCFIEPEDLDNHNMIEILSNFTDIINSKEVISFFISLMQLENSGIFDIVG
jgi:chromatin segregation and condensation protein Rec8/ScpA/Scc1 (kleisin family)